jgi:hypothetical protein
MISVVTSILAGRNNLQHLNSIETERDVGNQQGPPLVRATKAIQLD